MRVLLVIAAALQLCLLISALVRNPTVSELHRLLPDFVVEFAILGAFDALHRAPPISIFVLGFFAACALMVILQTASLLKLGNAASLNVAIPVGSLGELLGYAALLILMPLAFGLSVALMRNPKDP